MKRTNFLTSIRDICAPIVNILDKMLIEPIRYGIGKQYNAEKYWHDRFKKFGMSLRASANRQQTEEENEVFYRASTQSFLAILEQEKVDLSRSRVLDIGCGTGYYTRFCHEQGVTGYTGVDITDILFPELKKMYPDYHFLKRDCTRETINGRYDCILMLDVAEHITEKDRLRFTFKSAQNALSDTGILILAPVMDKAWKKLSYVRFWTAEEIASVLVDCRITASMPFPDGTIVAIRKQ